MERRLWVFAIFFASIAACVFGADSQRTGASELTALSGLDTPGVCDALDMAYGKDICAQLGDVSPPSATQMSSQGATVCSSYNLDDPDGYDDVAAYLYNSLYINPVGCFRAFVSHCNWEFDTLGEQTEAFANWTANYQELYEYLMGPEEGIVGPDCLSIFPTEEQLNRLTGTNVDAAEFEPCDLLPDFDETTPLRVDWNERGFVTPITDQMGGTCYAHATVNWFASQALMMNLTDESGQHWLTNTTVLSVQPLLDCMQASTSGVDAPCDGGHPENVSMLLNLYGTTSSERFPYFSDTYAKQNNLPQARCFAPTNPACADLSTNKTLLYKLPDEMAELQGCELSESQLARFIADHGPVVLAFSVGPLSSKWQPYMDAERTIKAPWDGRLGEGNMSYCGDELNHGVLMTGYDFTDQQAPHWTYKNSWGTDVGLDGYFWARASPLNSSAFYDRNHTGACGINRGVWVWGLPEEDEGSI